MNLVTNHLGLPSMSSQDLQRVKDLEKIVLLAPQSQTTTFHIIHGGMYARTLKIPSGMVLTGALIKIATILIVNGDATVYIGNGTMRLTGYHVLPASAKRKQAFVAHEDTYLTMIFPTTAKDTLEAEAAFTDEADKLFSRNYENEIIITGE